MCIAYLCKSTQGMDTHSVGAPSDEASGRGQELMVEQPWGIYWPILMMRNRSRGLRWPFNKENNESLYFHDGPPLQDRPKSPNADC